MSTLKDRSGTLFAVLIKIAVLMVGGVLLFLLVFLPLGVERLIAESHGLIGFLFGIVFVFGMAAVGVLIWLFTGRNFLDEILF